MTRALLILNTDDDRKRASTWVEKAPAGTRMEMKYCGYCGKSFSRDIRCTYKYWAKAKYCSQECAGKANSARYAAKRPSLKDAFQQYVSEAAEGCWVWTGLKDGAGYGQLAYAKKMYRANRLALKFDGREVPPGMYACHKCDNTSCVNPAHLFVGSPQDNSNDAMAKGRQAKGAKMPHSRLTEDAVREIRRSTETHEALAKRFNVSRATVSMASEGKTWTHVK